MLVCLYSLTYIGASIGFWMFLWRGRRGDAQGCRRGDAQG